MENDKIVKIIRGATEEVFSMMLSLPIAIGDAHEEAADSQSFDGVVALVGLAGAWVGAGRLSCSSAFACQVSSALLAAEYTFVNEDVLDAIAEVTNMIIGNVKSQLEDDYGAMGLSIPTVIFGRNYKARSSNAGTWQVVPFFCNGERMDIRICLVPGGQSNIHRPEAAVQQAL